MQLLKYKFFALLAFFALFLSSSSVSLAAAPHIIGSVVNKNTGEGIPGIIVRWEDSSSNRAANPSRENGVRYAVSDASGNFRFVSWHLPPEQGGLGGPNGAELKENEHEKEIDLDYNGSIDAKLISTDDPKHFGCLENPHNFSVLPKPNMNGRFENLTINTVDLINGAGTQNIGTFYFIPEEPPCAVDIKKEACYGFSSTAWVSWKAPEGGATGYEVFYDQYPFGDNNFATDKAISNTSNQLGREIPVEFNVPYRVQVTTVRQANDKTVKSTGSCTTEFSCTGTTPPPSPNPPPSPTTDPQKPTGTFSSELCPVVKTGQPFYCDVTTSNIDLKNLPFLRSKVMMSFSLDSNTQKILDFLTNQSNSSNIPNESGFSLWNEAHRPKKNGDYFGFYLTEFTSLPTNNILRYTLDNSSQIGTSGKTIADLRNYLETNNISTVLDLKSNMWTRVGEKGEVFNSHIGQGSCDIALSQDEYCLNPPPIQCPTCIPITIPADTGLVVPDSNNRIKITWTVPANTPATTKYEVVVYNKSQQINGYANAESAYQSYQTAYKNGEELPQHAKVYVVQANSLTADLDEIIGENIAVGIRHSIVITPQCTPTTNFCNWTEKDINLGFTVTGTIYNSEACVASAANEVTDMTDSNVVAKNIPSTEVPAASITGSSYTIILPRTNPIYTLQLQMGAASASTYSCSPCNPSGTTCEKGGITPPTGNTPVVVPFFVNQQTVVDTSWWNVYGGQVYSKNIMNSELPLNSSNETSLTMRLIRRLITGNNDTAGIPITTRGTFGNGQSNYSNVAGWLTEREPDQYQAPGVTLNLTDKPDFDYYKGKVILPTTRLPDEVRSLTDLNGQENNGVKVHYKESTLKFMPNETWSAPGHNVVLVNGDIIFSAERLAAGNDTLVNPPQGSTTTFVASGNIIISGNVGNTEFSVDDLTALHPNLSGIFIAKNIVVQGYPVGSPEKRFVGSGSFIGWDGVQLLRQFNDNNLNIDTPAESFIYRPDLITNMPNVLRNSSITWREVN